MRYDARQVHLAAELPCEVPEMLETINQCKHFCVCRHVCTCIPTRLHFYSHVLLFLSPFDAFSRIHTHFPPFTQTCASSFSLALVFRSLSHSRSISFSLYFSSLALARSLTPYNSSSHTLRPLASIKSEQCANVQIDCDRIGWREALLFCSGKTSSKSGRAHAWRSTCCNGAGPSRI